jgi:hypothetical protein
VQECKEIDLAWVDGNLDEWLQRKRDNLMEEFRKSIYPESTE